MKTHPLRYRTLFVGLMLFGVGSVLNADPARPPGVSSSSGQGHRIEKKGGLFSKLFGHKTVKVEQSRPQDTDEDDDDDDRASRTRAVELRLGAPSTGTAIISGSAAATKRDSIPPRYFDADQGSRLDRNVAPPASEPSSARREVQSAPSPSSNALPPVLKEREPRAADRNRDRKAAASSAGQASSASGQPSTTTKPKPATPRDTANTSASPSQGREDNAASTAASQGQPSTPDSLPPFAKPVPGRPGFAYPPGQEAIPANMIDVSGYAPGTKVRDPESKVVFRVP